MKAYNNEKAVISLTSWRKRIEDAAKTIFSIYRMCPGFHIVLVLSEDEFPQKEAELPSAIMAFANQDLIEILWVKENYRSFKKVIFTADKYRDVPIISADDDFIYKYNYAEELYQVWRKNPTAIVCERKVYDAWGFATLHPPGIYPLPEVLPAIKYCIKNNCSNDDRFYTIIAQRKRIPVIGLGRTVADVCFPINSPGSSSSLVKERRRLRQNANAIIRTGLSQHAPASL